MAHMDDGVEQSVRIRMYGQGLGDCFLLSFPRTGDDADRPVHVVIDCGVVAGTPDDRTRLERIATDIAVTTDKHLDLLVITHEHWDHVSGFLKAKAIWDDIEIDRMWLAWTERDDPDGLPGVLRRILEKHRMALATVADRSIRLGRDDRAETVRSLMGFLADSPEPGMSFAAAPTVSDAMEAALELVNKEDREYLEPGEVRHVPGTGVRCYVLGPPRSDTRLRQTDPSKDKETFELAVADSGGASGWGDALDVLELAELDEAFPLQAMEESHSQFNSLAMSILGPTLAGMDSATLAGLDETDRFRVAAELETYERTFPFDRTYRVPLAEADRAAREDPAGYPALASYVHELNHWRRIDLDWVGPVEELALQADHLTNNTSLVLAFELPATEPKERKILLFVGDAQVGNWLSWGDITGWTGVNGAEPKTDKVDINEMLGRVAFYKVGHHGSHNATLKKAVEGMSGDGSLVAYVPVSIPVAHEIKGWTKMPRESLVTALSDRSMGGVLFPDGDIGPGLEGEEREAKIGAIRYERSDEEQDLPEKRKRVKAGPDKPATEVIEGKVPLWVQVTIPY